MRKKSIFRLSGWDCLEMRITPSAVGIATAAHIVRIDASVHHSRGHSGHIAAHKTQHVQPLSIGTIYGYNSRITITGITSTGIGSTTSNDGTGSGTIGAVTGGFHPTGSHRGTFGGGSTGGGSTGGGSVGGGSGGGGGGNGGY